MKLLIAGANTFVGTKLIPYLLQKKHEVVCLVRDRKHFLLHMPFAGDVTVITGDLLRGQSIEQFPDIDAAFYLVSSMTQTSGFAGLEALSAENFMRSLNRVNCKQIITLSEISSDYTDQRFSRQHVEEILSSGHAELTVLKTSLVVGPDSIVVELLRGLTESSPVMIAGSWAKAQMQPIATIDVLKYFEACILNPQTYGGTFEMGGPEVISFRRMLEVYGEVCNHRKISIRAMSFMSAKLSAYWLNFLTPFNYTQAKNLIDSLKFDNIVVENPINDIIPVACKHFSEALVHGSESDAK